MDTRCVSILKVLITLFLFLFVSSSWATTIEELEGIYVVNKTKMTPGGFYNVIPTAYVLFKNGVITSRFMEPPEQLNIEKLSTAQPKNWGKWKKKGNKIQINWNDGDEDEWDKWSIGIPAKSGEKITGRFYRVSGGGNFAQGGTITYGMIKEITFNDMGQFTTVKNTQAVFPSSEVFEHESKSGRYKLYEHTIELHYNNGQQEKRAFYFYHGKNYFGIGGSQNVYSPRKKK